MPYHFDLYTPSNLQRMLLFSTLSMVDIRPETATYSSPLYFQDFPETEAVNKP